MSLGSSGEDGNTGRGRETHKKDGETGRGAEKHTRRIGKQGGKHKRRIEKQGGAEKHTRRMEKQGRGAEKQTRWRDRVGRERYMCEGRTHRCSYRGGANFKCCQILHLLKKYLKYLISLLVSRHEILINKSPGRYRTKFHSCHIL